MKYLVASLIAASLIGCASSKLETPEGTYRWQRGGVSFQPGKWVLETPVEPQAIADPAITESAKEAK